MLYSMVMTMKMLSRRAASFTLLASATLGCATGGLPNRGLLEAREAYAQMEKGSAPTYDRAGVQKASEALKQAEWASNNSSQSFEATDKAYIALRTIQIAEARGAANEAKGKLTQAQRDLELAGNLNNRLGASEQGRLAAEGQLNQTRQELESERQARLEAERRAQEALDQLSKIASVKQEARGLVITLSGSVLFASGKSALLPAAQDRLSQVADALKGSPNRDITIEGHTDSRGSAALNEALSLKRAESVRSYLAERGVPAERMKAVGLGPQRPVADNASAEGRANNRRVEIVIANDPNAAGAGSAVPPAAAGTPPVQPRMPTGTSPADGGTSATPPTRVTPAAPPTPAPQRP